MCAIRVASCNIQELIHPDKLEPLQADIVFLQETPQVIPDFFLAYPYRAIWPLEPSLKFIGKSMGLAIASKYMVLEIRKLLFEDPGWKIYRNGKELVAHPKGALLAVLSTPHGRLNVACVHFLPSEIFGFSEQSNQSLEYMKTVSHSLHSCYPPLDLIAGDFNNEGRLGWFSQIGFQSCTDGQSTRDNGKSHDDVLVGSRFMIKDASIIPNTSDHHIVLVDIVEQP